jgi:flagellar hook assembly protein FlgD
LTGVGANPTMPPAHFDLALPAAASADVVVYDVGGRRVRSLLSGPRAAGTHRVTWDGRDDAEQPARPGVYFVRATSGERRIVRKLILVR